ncbi:MAG: extracellular solute-binding protein [Lachnospiraceae bacterium]|nr:extracellular solute-binding protein [Lachnospiraceae bacterium]
MKKKLLASLLTAAMVLSLAACGGKSEEAPANTPSETTEGGSEQAEQETPAAGETIELSVWTANELHNQMFEFGEKAYNEKHPDNPVKLNIETYPNTEMANKLLIALQSGTGAPDIADININYFTNFTKGQIDLVPLNDLVEREIDNCVASRFDLYKKGDDYYGIPTHVGATCVYWNMNIVEEAGFSIDDINAIKTWDEYKEMGIQILEKTGKPMTIFEVADQRPFWPLIVQAGGDYLTADNEVVMDSAENVKVLEWMKDFFDTGAVVPCPGGATGMEEFWTWLNGGGCASLTMPAWYMSRFTNYMPDLKGRVAITPMPVFEEGQPRTVGIGGTGTAITTQCKNVEIAKEVLYESKMTYEANVNIWEVLQFDPVRTDVWSDEKLLEPMEYFYNQSFFEIMKDYVVDAPSPSNPDLATAAQDLVKNTVMYNVFVAGSETPEEALKNAAEELRAQQ